MYTVTHSKAFFWLFAQTADTESRSSCSFQPCAHKGNDVMGIA